MATQSSILAWEIPWTEEPGGLQSMGPQTVGHDGHDLATNQQQQPNWNQECEMRKQKYEDRKNNSRIKTETFKYTVSFNICGDIEVCSRTP